MVDSIRIVETAPYGKDPVNLSGLSQFNFFYGANGSGKTTITRIIAREMDYPTCTISWKRGSKLEALVYNKDFVDANFHAGDLKGIFTLGEKSIETQDKVAAVKKEIDELKTKIEMLNRTLTGDDTLGGKKAERRLLESELKETCWVQKQKHDAKLQGAFVGLRSNQEKFKDQILHELANNSAELVTQEVLEEKAAIVFGPDPVATDAIPTITSSTLASHESNSILGKRVLGKEDIDIAAMIKKLGNSDWVKQGREFLVVSDGHCPFCQQEVADSFEHILNEYFDEAFEADSRAIDTLSTEYKTDTSRVQLELSTIIEGASSFLNVESLKREKEIFDGLVRGNLSILESKRKEPSQTVSLESMNNVISRLTTLLADANQKIIKHNTTVAHLSEERKTLRAQVWKYLVEYELKQYLDTFQSKRNGLDAAIASIERDIAAAARQRESKTRDLRELEKLTTSIQPTIDGINSLLASFGFTSFSIAKAAEGDYYKLLRADGSDARTTLSEGEKNFLTFLYFYHLLKGSDSESGMTTDRIVVFDDPVSSLDSDILFIVSSLIKGLFEEVRNGHGHVKQVFVLTHNVYFHKEVTYNRRRVHEAMSEETFWVVRKTGTLSKVEKHASNPVKTSYELLWSEVRRDDCSHLTIQNTLRRILENYFQILGGIDHNDVCAMFEGKERLITRSLFSWVNDGSHFASDDLYISIDETMVKSYLDVFKGIFEKSGHRAHYDMMMGHAEPTAS